MHGTNTLSPEVTHISIHGFWLLLGDEELLVPFSEFPWGNVGPFTRYALRPCLRCVSSGYKLILDLGSAKTAKLLEAAIDKTAWQAVVQRQIMDRYICQPVKVDS